MLLKTSLKMIIEFSGKNHKFSVQNNKVYYLKAVKIVLRGAKPFWR